MTSSVENISVAYPSQLLVVSNSTGIIVNFYVRIRSSGREASSVYERQWYSLRRTDLHRVRSAKAVEATFGVEMSAGCGVVSYQVKPNENGLDIFTFRGTVEQNVAVALGLDLDGRRLLAGDSPCTITVAPRIFARRGCTSRRETMPRRSERVRHFEIRVHGGHHPHAPTPITPSPEAYWPDPWWRRTSTATVSRGPVDKRETRGAHHAQSLVSAWSTFEYVPNINYTGYGVHIFSGR